MHDLLLRLIAHMRWADALVADALEQETPAEAESMRLFTHIAAAEHLWFARIQSRRPAFAVWPELSLADARALAAKNAAAFESLMAERDTTALARRVLYTNSAGRQFENKVSDIVMHLAMHGEHHRGQIARLLRAAGREPPQTDYIQFARLDQL